MRGVCQRRTGSSPVTRTIFRLDLIRSDFSFHKETTAQKHIAIPFVIRTCGVFLCPEIIYVPSFDKESQGQMIFSHLGTFRELWELFRGRESGINKGIIGTLKKFGNYLNIKPYLIL